MAVLACSFVPGSLWAQAGASGVVIDTSLNVLQSFTDNRALVTTDKRSDATTQISPAVRISSRSGNIQGALDYTLNAQVHASDSSRNDVVNALASSFKVTAIEQSLWVDVRASIAQQSLSAFGVQAPTPLAGDLNRAEQRALSVSPVFRTRLGGMAQLEGRLSWTRQTGGTAAASNTRALVGGVRVFGQMGPLNWSADTSDTITTYELGRETKNRRDSFSLGYRPHYDWELSLRAGRETDTVRSIQVNSTSNWGLGAKWIPTARTQVNVQYDRRYFGNGYAITVSHLMARSIWTYNESRDASADGSSDRGLGFATAYDELFAKLASQIPDPFQRDLQVRALLVQQGGFTARAATVSRRRNLSFALNGQLFAATVSAFQSDSQRLDAASAARDDLSLAGRIRQQGMTVNTSYRLTPTASASVAYALSTTLDSGSIPGNTLRTLSATYSSQLARRVTLSLSLRHAVFDSVTQPYVENGGQASLGMQF